MCVFVVFFINFSQVGGPPANEVIEAKWRSFLRWQEQREDARRCKEYRDLGWEWTAPTEEWDAVVVKATLWEGTESAEWSRSEGAGRLWRSFRDRHIPIHQRCWAGSEELQNGKAVGKGKLSQRYGRVEGKWWLTGCWRYFKKCGEWRNYQVNERSQCWSLCTKRRTVRYATTIVEYHHDQ